MIETGFFFVSCLTLYSSDSSVKSDYEKWTTFRGTKVSQVDCKAD